MSTLDPRIPAACPACGANDLSAIETRAAFVEGDRLVAVEGIPGFKCPACGHESHEPTTEVALNLLRGDGLPADPEADWPRARVFRFGDSPYG